MLQNFVALQTDLLFEFFIFCRISVIFHVRSAKAVKITDMDLIKKLGIIVLMFASFLFVRTIVAPPSVSTVRTADDLKAYLCEMNSWDHWFSISELR